MRSIFIVKGNLTKHSVFAVTQVRQVSPVNRILHFGWCLCALIVLSTLSAAPLAASDNVKSSASPLVAVASSLRTLWPDLTEAYQTDTAHSSPRASFASSGLLSTQIRHGAPFDLFLSADLDTVQRLQESGKAMDDGISIATGGLSLVSRKQTGLQTKLTLKSMQSILAKSPGMKLAMPNPRHAPYGAAAQQALISAELWPLPDGTVLSAENASQTLQYTLSGAAAFGIVPTTLVTPVPARLNAIALPNSLYQAVDHRAVLLISSGESARAFMHWLTTPSAQSVLQQSGLSLPE